MSYSYICFMNCALPWMLSVDRRYTIILNSISSQPWLAPCCEHSTDHTMLPFPWKQLRTEDNRFSIKFNKDHFPSSWVFWGSLPCLHVKFSSQKIKLPLTYVTPLDFSGPFVSLYVQDSGNHWTWYLLLPAASKSNLKIHRV